jgi:hypothetical protein
VVMGKVEGECVGVFAVVGGVAGEVEHGGGGLEGLGDGGG